MADLTDLTQYANETRIVAEARLRVSETDAYQAYLKSRYKTLHDQYAPLDGDQWPSDKNRPGRNGKIHLTSNLLKPAVDIGARLEAKLPRLALPPTSNTDAERARAETAEKGMLTFLELSGWDVWMQDLARIKRLYGKGVLKPYWNKQERRPDVLLIEDPSNLRIGWGSSDFRQIDWALYEYALSPFEVMRRWPDVRVEPSKGKDQPLRVQKVIGDHSDPLALTEPSQISLPNYQPSDYERKQVKVWDYWYKDRDGKVHNAIILGERVVAEEAYHRELPDIPYIPIENDHEPGSPEGLSSIEHVIDLQEEINRLLSQAVQLIVDNLDPAWQVDGGGMVAGRVPKAGEILDTGEKGVRITAIDKPINEFPVIQILGALMDQYHKVTGLNPIMFGDPTGSQVSGRALAVMIDAYSNRGEPSRTRLYAGLRDLLIFWTIMLERLNPKIEVDGKKEGLADTFKGFRRWKLIGPEITPKDVIENTTNEINKVNAKVQSLRTTMDNLGIDSPEDELDLIALERTDLNLYPGDVQVMMAVYAALQQLQLTPEQLRAQLQGDGAAQNAAQQAQPALSQADNEAGAQPATAEGGIPPGLGLQSTSLIRSTASQQPQALNQLSVNRAL